MTFGDYRDDLSNGPLYAVVGIFLAAIGGAAIYSFFQNRKDEAGDDEKAVEAHFLGGRSFGMAILFLSTFSTQYSGYTVAGIPKESSGLGWFSLRWVTGMTSAMMMMPLICPRVRRIAIARNWMSPNDIVNDRFNSKLLTRTFSICSAAGTFLYVVVQFYSLAQIVETSTLGAINGFTAARILAAYIWCAEFLGGLRSVAFTDSIQASIMLVCFLIWPLIIFGKTGGFAGVTGPNCQNAINPRRDQQACTLSNQTDVVACARPDIDCSGLGCWGPFTKASGCLAYSAPWLELYPSVSKMGDICNSPSAPKSWNGNRSSCMLGALDKNIYFNYVTLDFFTFSLPWVSVQLAPQLVQRIMSAKTEASIKQAQLLLIPAFIPAFLGSLVVGITAKALYPTEMTGGETAFSVMSNHLRDEGGFNAFLGTLLVASAIAAIMSTADSVTLSASSILTLDFIKPVTQQYFDPAKKIPNKYYVEGSKAISAIILFGSCEYALSDTIMLDPLAYSTIVTWQGSVAAPFAMIQIFGLILPDRWISGWAAVGAAVFAYITVLIWELYPEVEDPTSMYWTNGKPGVGNQPPTALQFGFFWSFVVSIVTYPPLALLFNNVLPEFGEDADKDKMHPLRKMDCLDADQRKQWDENSTCDKINDESLAKIIGPGEPIAKKTLGIPNWAIMIGQYVVWFLTLPWWETSESVAAIDSGAGIPRWALVIIVFTALNIAVTVYLMSQWDVEGTASNKVVAITANPAGKGASDGGERKLSYAETARADDKGPLFGVGI